MRNGVFVGKPVICAVDDPQVLSAVRRDLRRRYGREYRTVRESSGQAELGTPGRIKLRNDPVALFPVDHRVPRMTGVEFLQRAKQLFPDAKRNLLTAYANIDAAIRAIYEVELDYNLVFLHGQHAFARGRPARRLGEHPRHLRPRARQRHPGRAKLRSGPPPHPGERRRDRTRCGRT